MVWIQGIVPTGPIFKRRYFSTDMSSLTGLVIIFLFDQEFFVKILVGDIKLCLRWRNLQRSRYKTIEVFCGSVDVWRDSNAADVFPLDSGSMDLVIRE